MTRVTVLLGGLSNEREVSLSSGREIAAALREAGFEVTIIDPGPDLGALVSAITASRPDAVFNALHGRFGDMVAVTGDPTRNVRLLEAVDAVIKGGVLVVRPAAAPAP